MTTKPSGDHRPIQFPINRTDEQAAIVLNEPVLQESLAGWSSSDPDERVNIVLCLSLNEYVALANCIDVGRDLAYGENSQYLWWLWCKVLASMDICEAVLSCLQNNQDVRDYISELIAGTVNEVLPDAFLDDTLYAGDPQSCDVDKLYGGCVALFDFIDQRSKDFLEIMDSASNVADRISDAIEAVPILGELPFDDLIEAVGDLGEYTYDAYLAALTTGLRQQIICDLWCIAQFNCSLTYRDVMNYFFDFFAEPVNVLNTFNEFIDFLVTGTWTGSSLVYVMTCFQLFSTFHGSEFVGVDGTAIYDAVFASGDPDTDHELFCDCPDDWQHIFDFKADDGDWYNDPYGDGWVDGMGWQSSTLVVPPRQEQNYISRDFDDTSITYVRVEFIGEGFFATYNLDQYLRVYKYLNAVQTQIFVQLISGLPATGGVVVFNDPAGQTMDKIEIEMNPVYSSKFHYTRVIVRGKGTDPF